jgi:hypothetical protein
MQGAKQKTPAKKDAKLKRNGLRKPTFDEKRGTPKTQEAK